MANFLLERQEGWRDLAVGEPVFLRENLQGLYPLYETLRPLAPGYPSAAGDEDLRKAVVKFLGRGSAERVVITNGALQALSASMYALKSVHCISTATARTPYFPYFKPLAKQAGLHWCDDPGQPDFDDGVEILAWPNNPTGCDPAYYNEKEGRRGDLMIWDAAYAHPQYGVEVETVRCAAEVGSVAKAFGISGLRVGWALFQTDVLARKAAEYVELTTAGVGMFGQEWLRNMLRIIERHPCEFQGRIADARRDLIVAGHRFKEHLGDHMYSVKGVPAGHGGMFAYFQPRDPQRWRDACEKLKIRVALGGNFGDDWSRYRMNLGGDCDELIESLEDLGRELNR